jgi:hypothetical protein
LAWASDRREPVAASLVHVAATWTAADSERSAWNMVSKTVRNGTA